MKVIYLRVEDALHDQLTFEAQAEGRSLTNYLTRKLEGDYKPDFSKVDKGDPTVPQWDPTIPEWPEPSKVPIPYKHIQKAVEVTKTKGPCKHGYARTLCKYGCK